MTSPAILAMQQKLGLAERIGGSGTPPSSTQLPASANAAQFASGPSLRLKYRALYDYVPGADPPNQLGFKVNDTLWVTNNEDYEQWFMAERDGESGLIPSNYVEKCKEAMSTAERIDAGEDLVNTAPSMEVSKRKSLLSASLPQSMGGCTPDKPLPDESIVKPLSHTTASRPRPPGGRRSSGLTRRSISATPDANNAAMKKLTEQLERERAVSGTLRNEADSLRKMVNLLESRLGPEGSAEDAAQEIATLKRKLAEEQAARARLDAEVVALRADAAEHDAEKAKATARAEEERSANARAMDDRARAAEEWQGTLERAQRELEESQRELEGSQRELEGSQRELEAALEEAQQAREEVKTLTLQDEEHQAQLVSLKAEVSTLSTALAAGQDGQGSEVAALQQELTRRCTVEEGLQEDLRKERAAVQAAARAAERAEQESARANAEADRAAKDAASANQRLAAEQQNTRTLTAQHERALESLRGELARVVGPASPIAQGTPPGTPPSKTLASEVGAEEARRSMLENHRNTIEASLGDVNRRLHSEERTKDRMDKSVQKLETELVDFKRKLGELLSLVEQRKKNRPTRSASRSPTPKRAPTRSNTRPSGLR